MNLYELNKMYGEALSLAITDDGEIIDDSLTQFLDEIQEAKETKLLNLACLIKNIEAEEEAIRIERGKLAERLNRLENKSRSLRKYLADNMDSDKLKDGRCEIGFRKSKSVEIDGDLSKMESIYVRVKYEPNKTLIRKAIEDGHSVQGASLVENRNLVIK